MANNFAENEIEVGFPPKLAPLFRPARYKVLWGGRDAGRSWGAARALLTVGYDRPLRILCAREIQNTLADSVHRLLCDQIQRMGLDGFYKSTEHSISGINGTEFIYSGLRNLDASKIKSYEGVDIAWVEESENLTKRSFNILDPTIRKDGSELWFTFNAQLDTDFIYDHFVVNQAPGAVVIYMNFNDNPWASKALIEGREHMRRTDPEEYDNIWMGKVRTSVIGAIYANELRAVIESGRVCEVKHDPAVDVSTAWDIGHTDDTAIWWYQIVGGEIHVLEGYSKSGGTPSEFATQILGRKVQIDLVDGELKVTLGEPVAGLAHRRSYKYGTHWLPHDARAKTLAAHGKSTQEQLQAALGWTVEITPSLDREDGIKAARSTLGRCWFDKDGCAEGLGAMRRYRRELRTDGISLAAIPLHDWSSNYADAFRYLSVAWSSPRMVKVDPPARRDAYDNEPAEQTWKTA